MDCFSWRQWRKNAPVPPTDIPYGPYSVALENGNVYSIDKFRPRFPFEVARRRPDQRLGHEGLFLPVTDDDRVAAVSELLRQSNETVGEFEIIRHDSGRYGGNVHWWAVRGGVVTLHRFKPFGSESYAYSLLLEFNPNKAEIPFWRDLISRINSVRDKPGWRDTRTDYALDIPFPISDVRLLTRKVGSSYLGTYYFGTRGQSGYTRVYDKRKEILDKQRKDICREVTRIEWEARAGAPLHMDFPFILGDLGRHEVLRYVPMSDWPLALRTFNEATASKIRKNCLTPVDVDSTIYDRLRAEMLEDLGLLMSDCLDTGTPDIATEDSSDLERIQSQLRKWAGVEH